MMSDADRAVAEIMTRHPTLGMNGWEYRVWEKGTYKVIDPDRDGLRDPRSVRMVETCLRWLDFVPGIKRPNLGSYGLKHSVERWGQDNDLEPYVANGTFIVAALWREIPMYRRWDDGPNCRFALSRRHVRAIDKQRRLISV